MDRYQKVEKPKPESPIKENEIRITSQGAIRNYISYAITLLQEKHAREIILKAMGLAISKAVAIAEILKSKVPRLYQDTAISSISITDVWEPIEEGLVPVEMTRHVSMISITLSPKELNRTSPGYQAPPNTEQVKPQYNHLHQLPPKQVRGFYNAVNDDSYGRGHGRAGRGRGHNSWGRGGYGSNQGRYTNYQGGYNNYHGGYDNYQGGYGNYQRGNDNYQHGNGNYQRGNGYDQGGYGYDQGGYGYDQDNGGYSTRRRASGRGRSWGSRGAGFERGRGGGGGGGRGYIQGSRGRNGGGRSRGGGRNHA